MLKREIFLAVTANENSYFLAEYHAFIFTAVSVSKTKIPKKALIIKLVV